MVNEFARLSMALLGGPGWSIGKVLLPEAMCHEVLLYVMARIRNQQSMCLDCDISGSNYN